MNNNLKIIFLDYDGVLTSAKTSYHLYDPKKYKMDQSCFKALKKIIARTGAKIVLSTNWRNNPDDWEFDYFGTKFKSPIVNLRKKLEKYLRGGKLEYKWAYECPHLRHHMKCDDILGFFYSQGLDPERMSFAVLDDQLNQGLHVFKDCFFAIPGETGLTDSIADSIIQHLNYADTRSYYEAKSKANGKR